MSDIKTKNYSKLIVDTGNLINCAELKRKTSQSPTDELVESVSCSISSYLGASNAHNLQDGQLIIKSQNQTIINQDERKDLKITVKVFLTSYNCDLLREAINQVMIHLDLSVLDSIILALPSTNNSPLFMENLHPLWRVLEELNEEKKLVIIGVCDLDAQKLKELFEWASIKPSVNQVNLESCCIMPPEMTLFAKENDIQLLTHSDPKILLPVNSLKKILEPLAVEATSVWKSDWILRYSTIVKCRGIIQSRGYILCTSKET